MKLYFSGHDERYAVEQTMLTLFQGERPVYPEESPKGEDGELTLSLLETEGKLTATAHLRYDGKTAAGEDVTDAVSPEMSLVERKRQRRRCLQRAFYRAAVDVLGAEPPWGMLSGVRPVKLPVREVLKGATMEEAKQSLLHHYRVTPSRVRLAMDCAEAALAVKQTLAPRDIFLYVGIPFCPSRCTYCSFVSAAAGGHKLIEPYLQALFQEIDAAGKRCLEQGTRVVAVYVGGGTPTTLSPDQLSALLSRLRKAFALPPDLELTVEAGRPDSITREKLIALQENGANRISLNPQTMSAQVLRAIGRQHTAQDIRDAWPLVREEGFSSVNMDLIAGLPEDTLEGFQNSLSEVIAFGPENITVHSLALKRGSTLHSNGGSLPGGEQIAHMLEHAWQSLYEAGYRPYYLYRQKYSAGSFENVGWSRPGHSSAYNIGMMEELGSTLALGAGGVSKTVHYDKGSISRLANPKYPQDYLKAIADILLQKTVMTV